MGKSPSRSGAPSAGLAVDTMTRRFLSFHVAIRRVKKFLEVMLILVRDDVSSALLGCCVRPIQPSRTCVRGSRIFRSCFEHHSLSCRTKVRGAHDDIGEGWCLTCPPRMLRPTNVTMIHVREDSIQSTYSRPLRFFPLVIIHAVQQYVVAMSTLLRNGDSPLILRRGGQSCKCFFCILFFHFLDQCRLPLRCSMLNGT